MATRDDKGYIRYSQEELNKIPPYDVRARGTAGNNRMARASIGALGGAAAGSVFGPAGTVIGGLAGAAFGGGAGTRDRK